MMTPLTEGLLAPMTALTEGLLAPMGALWFFYKKQVENRAGVRDAYHGPAKDGRSPRSHQMWRTNANACERTTDTAVSANPGKIAKCGYCVVCHRDAMRTYGLPVRCTSNADHRVDLPSNFVP